MCKIIKEKQKKILFLKKEKGLVWECDGGKVRVKGSVCVCMYVCVCVSWDVDDVA